VIVFRIAQGDTLKIMTNDRGAEWVDLYLDAMKQSKPEWARNKGDPGHVVSATASGCGRDAATGLAAFLIHYGLAVRFVNGDA
jgi:hypothetical protein